MKKIVLLVLFCILLLNPGAQAESPDQQAGPDSLYSVWEDQSHSDSVRVKAYKDFIWNNYLFSNPDSALVLIEAMHTFAKERNYPLAANQANTLIGIAHNIMGDFALGMEYTQKSLAANQEIGNKWGVSECEIVLGVLYDEQGNYPRALEHYKRALTIDEEIGNKEGMAMSLNNIGNIYSTQGNKDSALVYYKNALAIDRELGVKQGIAVELINMGKIYSDQGDTSAAISYYKEALAASEEVGDMESKAASISSMGALYEEQGENTRALKHFEEALAVYEVLGTPQGIAQAQATLGYYYLGQNKEARAIDFCLSSLDLAEEIGITATKRKACECLYRAHKALGNTGKALKYYEQMIEARDVLFNKENTKKLTQIQMQYEFDKKEAATLAEQEKKDAIARQELQRQKLVRNSFMGGFAVVLLFAGVFLVQRNRIGKEKERSEELLLNILPAETAQELKEKGHADAQLIDEVTVLFTDFKGFTAMSEKLSPEELVKDLHLCFSLFDQICQKHGIEKIKTIGDAYMAAGGLPTPNRTHAQDVVNAALEMAQVVEEGKAKKIADGLPFFEIRVGVHTGPVVAGIVGIKKFQYDIWGDTVNTASRMESSGAVGRVNVSQTTCELLQENPQFTFESRGKIKAKGKGEIDMYFVKQA